MDAATETAPARKTPSFRAGSELREARERLGWNLGEVATALRIKLAYLEAIEDGRISALPGNAYALGFLRTYATTLGLDPDEIARRFRAEASDVNLRPALAFPAPAPERGAPTGAMALIGIVLMVLAYGAYYRLSDHEVATTHTVPPVPEGLLAGRNAAVSPQVASVMPPPGTATPSAVPPAGMAAATSSSGTGSAAGAGVVTVPTAVPTPAPSPVSGAVPGATVASAIPPAAGAQPGPPAATAAGTAGAAGADAAGIVLHATAVTWVQLRAPDGKVVWDHVMQPGETRAVPADQPGYVLTTGNAGGLTLSDNGVSTGPLGREGAVRHNVALDDATIRSLVAGAPAAGAPLSPATPAAATPASTIPAATTPGTGTASGEARAQAGAPGSDAASPVLPVRHHIRKATPPEAVDPDSSADELNGRQLGAGHAVAPPP